MMVVLIICFHSRHKKIYVYIYLILKYNTLEMLNMRITKCIKKMLLKTE